VTAPMSAVTLIAVEAAIRLSDPSGRDRVVAESAHLQAATRTDEPGCLVYCFAADPVEPDLIQVYELWADEASLEAHFAHPNYAAMRELLNAAGLASAVSRKLRIDAAAAVYGPDHRPTAAFDRVDPGGAENSPVGQ
jgi:quinol monooxygenase YgiN